MFTPHTSSKPSRVFRHALSLPLTLALASSSLLISCGESSLAHQSLQSVSSLLPSRVAIAEVRPKDLKKMPTGADRALAWDRKLNRWAYVEVDYNPATLPEDQDLPLGAGLLPPLHPDAPDDMVEPSVLPSE